MDRNFPWFQLGCYVTLLFFSLAFYNLLSRICDRLTDLVLAVQELCDRIWELRND